MKLLEELGGRHWQVVRPGNTYEAGHKIESGIEGLANERTVTIENGSEGDLGALAENVERVLRGTWKERR